MTTSPLAPRSPRPRLFLLSAAGLCLASLAILGSDFEVSRAISTGDWPSDLRKLVTLCEAFGHGLGVTLILISTWVLAVDQRRKVPRIAISAFFSGMATNLIKLVIARYRPQFYYQSLPGPAAPKAEMESTFVTWFPAANLTDWSDHLVQSFPSSHTSTAFGLAVGLSWAFPRGRVLFFVLAGLAGLQRILSQSHWPSDVFVGAAVGLSCGTFICYSAAAQRCFARWEHPPMLPHN